MTEEMNQGVDFDNDDQQGNISFITLMHPLSKPVADGAAKPGEILVRVSEGMYESLALEKESGEGLVPGFTAVCWLYLLSRRRSIEGATECVGMKNDEGEWHGSIGKACKACSHYNDEMPGQYVKDGCKWRHNFFFKLIDGWLSEGTPPSPLVLGLEGASGGPAARYLKSVYAGDSGEAGKAIFWKTAVKLTVKDKPRKSGNATYLQWVAERAGIVPEPLMIEASEQYKTLRELGPLLLPGGGGGEEELPF